MQSTPLTARQYAEAIICGLIFAIPIFYWGWAY